MPLEWEDFPQRAPADAGARSQEDDAPMVRMTAWPHRSLPPRGFAVFIAMTFAFLMMPLIPFLGTPILWALLPFMLAVLALLWIFLRRSYRDGHVTEILTLWPDRLELLRQNPRAPDQHWEANPFWVRATLHPGERPVENYLTLSGGDRTVEVGAFLTPEERQGLHGDLERLLGSLKR